MEACKRMDRIGLHLSARGNSASDDDIVVVDAIRTPITRAKKVRLRAWFTHVYTAYHSLHLLSRCCSFLSGCNEVVVVHVVLVCNICLTVCILYLCTSSICLCTSGICLCTSVLLLLVYVCVLLYTIRIVCMHGSDKRSEMVGNDLGVSTCRRSSM